MEPPLDSSVDPPFTWNFELTIRFRSHDYQIKFKAGDPTPDCPLFDPPHPEDDQQDCNYDLGAWFIHREAGFPHFEVFENETDSGHHQPLRVLPKEGQLQIKVVCRTPEKDYTVFCLPYAPYQLSAGLLKRPSKPPKVLRQKPTPSKNLDGFYHVDRERGPTDNVVISLKHGVIKGVRFFLSVRITDGESLRS